MGKFAKNKLKKLMKKTGETKLSSNLKKEPLNTNKSIKKKAIAEKKIAFKKNIIKENFVINREQNLTKNVTKQDILVEKSKPAPKKPKSEEVKKPDKPKKIKSIQKSFKRKRTFVNDTKLLLELMNKKTE